MSILSEMKGQIYDALTVEESTTTNQSCRAEELRELGERWLLLETGLQIKVFNSIIDKGLFYQAEYLSTLVSSDYLTYIVSNMSEDSKYAYVKHYNEVEKDPNKHIVTHEMMSKVIEANCNVALCFIANSLVVNTCIDRMVRAWGETKFVNKKVFDCVKNIRNRWEEEDDVCVALARKNILPIIAEFLPSFLEAYEGSGCLVDDIISSIDDRTMNSIEEYYTMCDKIVCEDKQIEKMARYAFIIRCVLGSTCDEISRRSEVKLYERISKDTDAYKVDLSSTKKIIDNASSITNILTNYSISNKDKDDMLNTVVNRLTEVYAEHGKDIIEAFKEATTDFYAYVYGMIIYVRRNHLDMPQAFKDDCCVAYGNTMGYASVIKDIKKLETMTIGDTNPYSIASVLLEKFRSGEKFPAFKRMLNRKVKSHNVK